MTSFTLLNTRPEHQSRGLQQLVERAGGQALACPTIAIQWLNLPQQRTALSAFDKIVFISANAVHAFAKAVQPLPSSLPQLFAIGKATVKAGQKFDLAMQTAEGACFDSEALLEHPQLQQLQQQKILLVKGVQGRELLLKTLQQRGAQVEQWSLYRRQPVAFCRPAWLNFRKAAVPVVLASSINGLQNLMTMLQTETISGAQQDSKEQAWLNAQLEWLLQQPLVVFSERIKRWAQQHRWQGHIAVVATQSDQGVVDCINGLLAEKKG